MACLSCVYFKRSEHELALKTATEGALMLKTMEDQPLHLEPWREHVHAALSRCEEFARQAIDG